MLRILCRAIVVGAISQNMLYAESQQAEEVAKRFISIFSNGDYEIIWNDVVLKSQEEGSTQLGAFLKTAVGRTSLLIDLKIPREQFDNLTPKSFLVAMMKSHASPPSKILDVKIKGESGKVSWRNSEGLEGVTEMIKEGSKWKIALNHERPHQSLRSDRVDRGVKQL